MGSKIVVYLLTYIGVLTKPDRLPVGSRAEKMKAVLNGDRFTLGHGYFVVKNPSQDDIDRGLTHRDARMEERQFFERTEPWATTFRDYQVRFGTKALQKSLSETLAGQMGRSLPIIRGQAHVRLNQIDTELEKLPEPPIHNATRIISDMLLSFSNHVRREMEAEYPCRIWRNNWEKLHKNFYRCLLSMKPTMVLVGALDKGIYDTAMPGKSVDDAYVIESEDEDQDTPMSDSPETPTKKRKVESPSSSMRPPPSRHQTPARATPTPIQDTPIRGPNFKPTNPDANSYAVLRKQFRLDAIADELQEKSKSRLPDQLDPKVIDDMIVKTITNWDLPSKRLFEGLKDDLKRTVGDIFNEHFGQWSSSALHREAWKIVEATMDTGLSEQDMMAADSLTDEREGPFVFNEDVFHREKTSMREQYRKARYNARVKLYGQECLAKTKKEMTPLEQEKLRRDEKRQAILKVEPYEKEIDVISRVTSYYLLAARRFYESVCIRVESKFFKRLRTSLRDDLDSGLGIHDNEKGMSFCKSPGYGH